MTEAEKWKARAEQVYAHIYLDVPAGHHLHETNVATLKAALAEAYDAGERETREECAALLLQTVAEAMTNEREACALMVDNECARVLSKQTGEEYPAFGAGVDQQLRMTTVLLPEIAAAIRQRSLP